jgi:hypothetical protein
MVTSTLGAHRRGGGQGDARLFEPPQRDVVPERGRSAVGVGDEGNLVAVAVGVQGRATPHTSVPALPFCPTRNVDTLPGGPAQPEEKM